MIIFRVATCRAKKPSAVRTATVCSRALGPSLFTANHLAGGCFRIRNPGSCKAASGCTFYVNRSLLHEMGTPSRVIVQRHLPSFDIGCSTHGRAHRSFMTLTSERGMSLLSPRHPQESSATKFRTSGNYQMIKPQSRPMRNTVNRDLNCPTR